MEAEGLSGNQGSRWECSGVGGSLPRMGRSSVTKGHQWGDTGKARGSRALFRSPENTHWWRSLKGTSLLIQGSASPVCSSVPSRLSARPRPAIPRPHTPGRTSLTGAGRRVHPQDPAKARWLAGSSALLSGLLLFLLLPPLLFNHMEGWTYVEGFYFSFVTLSTVGFGDYVIGETRGAPCMRLLIARIPGHLLRAQPHGVWGPKVQSTQA